MKKTSIDNSGSKSISSIMFSPVDEDTHQKRMEPMELSWMHFDVCQTCNDSKAIIFDPETNEMVCSSCGIVLRDNVQASPELRGRKYSQEDIESRRRTGMPSSLAFHDMGLSTFISNSNMDAKGVLISSDQINKVKRMRHLNRISSSNRSHDRNLKNAFAILNSIKDKLSINDTLIEKSAYIYRKALDKRIIKGRSICAMMVASIYAACREANVPRTLDEIAQTANTNAIFAAKCYRLLVRNLKLRLPAVDSNVYLTKIANRANVSQKSCRRAVEMLSIIKDNPVSYGKDPNALAVATLYAACLKEGEKVSQLQIATAGNTSIVTLRKRFQGVRNLFPT
ncbi:MAG: TFIIB-type zinc ribbon-containing protein [Candidatus Nitrosopolaris sp.]|jgi:transcription initiation factor TFIIB